MQDREHDDVNIDEMHEQQPTSDSRQNCGLFLDGLEEQDQERDEKVADHHENGERIPAARVAFDEPDSFFRDIGIPDQKELAESDVSPEHSEGEHQLAHDVEMLERNNIPQVTGIPKQGRNDDQQANRA